MRRLIRAGADGSGPVPPVDAGTVTAELAVGMIGLGVVLAGALNVVQVGLVKLGTTDAATAAARALARGESSEVARDRAERLAGTGSEVTVDVTGRLSTATVTRRVGLSLPGGGQVAVTSTASSWTETGDEP